MTQTPTDSNSSAAKLRPKPRFPNAANAVTITSRTLNRASTCTDFSSLSADWGAAARRSHVHAKLSHADRLVERVGVLRHGRARWSGSTVRRCAGPRRRRSGSPAPDRHDGFRSIDRAIREARAGATVRNAIRLRHRRGGGPATAAAPGRSAPAPHRSMRPTGSAARRGRSSRSGSCEGKRRQLLAMMSDRNSAVTASASRSRSLSSIGILGCSERSDMASSHLLARLKL